LKVLTTLAVLCHQVCHTGPAPTTWLIPAILVGGHHWEYAELGKAKKVSNNTTYDHATPHFTHRQHSFLARKHILTHRRFTFLFFFFSIPLFLLL
jgi:hypothetical protein